MTKMKRFALATLCFAAMSFAGCTDKSDNPVVDDDVDIVVMPLPETDQMDQTTAQRVTILGSGFSQVAEAFIRRVEHPMTSITDETDAILIKGSDINVLANDDSVAPDIMEAIRQGKKLIIDQPTVRQMRTAAWLVFFQTYPAESNDEYVHIDTGGEEHEDHVCYDMIAIDADGNIYTLNDIFDEDDGEPEQELTPYLNGLHADPLAAWLNEQAEGNNAMSARAATRGASGDLASKMTAQNVTRSYTLKPSNGYESRLTNRSCVFTISTNIWAAYKYDEDADYYLIEQTVLGNSSNFWIGSWKGGNWNYQGFFLSREIVSNTLRKDSHGTLLKNSEGAVLIDYSPTSTTGQHSTTVEESWNLSGSVGVSGSGVEGVLSGGVGGSISNTYTTEDMTITALSMNDDNCLNNAAWQYDINTNNYDVSGWSGYSFRTPPILGTNAFKSAQCWLWKVEHPKNYGDIILHVFLGFDHSFNSYRNKTFSSYSENGNFFNGWYEQDIIIRPPYRETISK